MKLLPKNSQNRRRYFKNFSANYEALEAEFESQLVKKNQKRFDGLDEKIISLYARGMTTSEIKGHLEEIYGVEVSLTLISNVTDSVLDEVRAWQSRPLEAVYPILYLDA